MAMSSVSSLGLRFFTSGSSLLGWGSTSAVASLLHVLQSQRLLLLQFPATAVSAVQGGAVPALSLGEASLSALDLVPEMSSMARPTSWSVRRKNFGEGKLDVLRDTL